MNKTQLGVFHLEDNDIIISHTEKLISHVMGFHGISFEYRSGCNVLEITPTLLELADGCEMVVFISDRDLGDRLNGDVAIMAIAGNFHAVPIIIYTATSSSEEVQRLLNGAQKRRGSHGAPIVYAKKCGDNIASSIQGLLRSEAGLTLT